MIRRIFYGLIVSLALAWPASAQTTCLSNTTLAAAMTATQTTARVTTVTATNSAPGGCTPTVGNIVVGQMLYVEREGMKVLAINGTNATVQRGQMGTAATAHLNAATVFSGPEVAFRAVDPLLAACTPSAVAVRPWINTINGNLWVCNTNKWYGTNSTVLTYNSITPY
jgi:hypothetical protein